ncbi:hypothetical protein [Paracoccus tibetensis]|uniref:Glyceraldehyde-3-phosphate dehydrogenase n=1 Tax=Paracoccus tibetensis TaxID=336292 RepID=A0A1G5D597_9RHOB|nr:hypothetical protein [Paracoccus tibetensis]SCY09834.1 hypothetical protein SAMN05660710_00670 [Paracoccus tibetensis]
MTNQIAIALLILIALVLLADHMWLHMNLPLFIARQTDQFIEYLSFWR